MEELPSRPNKPIIPNIEAITSDPLLRMVMADYYNSPNLESYKSSFVDEQDEIVESLHEMGFRIVKKDEQFNATIIEPATTTEQQQLTASSDTGKTSDSITE